MGPPVLTSFVTLLSENWRRACISAALGPAITVALSVVPSLLLRTVGANLLTIAGSSRRAASGPVPTAGPGPATGLPPGPATGVALSPGPAPKPAALLLVAGQLGEVHPLHSVIWALGQFHP